MMLVKRHFDSALQMARYIETTLPIEGAGHSSYLHDHGSAWNRHQDWDAAQNILLNRGGYWKEGAEAIKAAKLKISAPMGESIKVAFKRDYAGARAHVPAYLAGSPKSMVRRVPVKKPAPVLRVAVNIGMLAGDDESESFNRGAALLSAIKSVESTGVAVELVAFSHVDDGGESYPGGRQFLLTVTLKRAQDRISIGDLSYMTCHCNALRRHSFAVREREEDFYLVTRDSYGKSVDTVKIDGFDVVIPKIGMGNRFTTPDNAMWTVKNLFENCLKVRA